MKRLTQEQVLLGYHLDELGLEPTCEYQFAPDRKWRADVACIAHRLLFEIDGGNYGSYDRVGRWTEKQGRHHRPSGFVKDMEKSNVAQMMGFRLLRFTPEQVRKGQAKAFVEKWLKGAAQ